MKINNFRYIEIYRNDIISNSLINFCNVKKIFVNDERKAVMSGFKFRKKEDCLAHQRRTLKANY